MSCLVWLNQTALLYSHSSCGVWCKDTSGVWSLFVSFWFGWLISVSLITFDLLKVKVLGFQRDDWTVQFEVPRIKSRQSFQKKSLWKGLSFYIYFGHFVSIWNFKWHWLIEKRLFTTLEQISKGGFKGFDLK